jgi:ribosomal protein S18 acetylase RimI-like enzyme
MNGTESIARPASTPGVRRVSCSAGGAGSPGIADGEVEKWNGSTVRRLMPEDAGAYLSVRWRALREKPPAFSSFPENQPDLEETAVRLAQKGDRCFLGAFQDRQIIAGIVRLSRYPEIEEQSHAYVAGLYVLPAFRRSGYGRALMQTALTWAASRNFRKVNLAVVTEQEPAIQLYESLGFRIYGLERATFSRDGRTYDEYLMTRELPRGSHQDAVSK